MATTYVSKKEQAKLEAWDTYMKVSHNAVFNTPEARAAYTAYLDAAYAYDSEQNYIECHHRG